MISAIILIAIVIGLYFLFKALGLTDISKEEIRDIVSQAGIWAPIAYIFVSFLQVTFIPIPGMVTILAGTLIFEPLEAFFYSLIGMFLGGSVGFYLGRILGKKFVYWVAGDKEKVDEYLEKIKGRETVLLFFMFLFPFFPDDLLCSVAGISKIKFKTFSIIQIFTRITSIGCTILVYGGNLIPLHSWGIAVIIGLSILGIIAFIISYKYADQIQEWFVNLYNKIGNWFKNLFSKKN